MFIYICNDMRRRNTNKEQLIKDTALKMIVKNGFDAFAMQKLAREACVSPATPYIYFRDKEHLILSMYKDFMDEMSASTLKNFDPEASFSEGLRIQWKNRADFYMQHRDKTIFLEQIRHSSLLEKAHDLVNPEFRTAMKTFVATAIKNKELAEIPIETYWSIAYAPLYSLIRFHDSGKSHMNRSFTLTDEILDATLEIVIKGLKP